MSTTCRVTSWRSPRRLAVRRVSVQETPGWTTAARSRLRALRPSTTAVRALAHRPAAAASPRCTPSGMPTAGCCRARPPRRHEATGAPADDSTRADRVWRSTSGCTSRSRPPWCAPCAGSLSPRGAAWRGTSGSTSCSPPCRRAAPAARSSKTCRAPLSCEVCAETFERPRRLF
ncbi:hypothetical protein ONE63_001096 [Megalurothrips usitatus]|uniref:Uncharacterized protein n=1 Tax=Megalurothrips usitatus TaxID=439358 RepID=A0AAV7XE51_9NEOP|nr:hypothetical protein ONE63_001096 [Megalurothrips usitatus]